MSRRIKLLLGGTFAGLLVVALAGLVLSTTVLAQTPPADQAKPVKPIENFISKLAAKLGISEDTLKGAIKDAETQIIDESVQQGKLSQDNADKLKKRIQDNPNGFGGFGFSIPRIGPKAGRLPAVQVGTRQIISDTAQILGISVTDLQAQVKTGQTLAEIAAASPKKMGRQDLINALVTQLSAAIDQRAKNNSKLTADQIQKLKDRLPQLVGRIVDAKHPAANGTWHWELKRGPRPGKGQGQQQQQQQQQPQQQRFVPSGSFGRGAI